MVWRAIFRKSTGGLMDRKVRWKEKEMHKTRAIGVARWET